MGKYKRKSKFYLAIFIMAFSAIAFAADLNPDLISTDQILSLNSSSLGFDGPFQLGGTYSEHFGYMLNSKFTHPVGNHNALSLEFDLGNNENRVGGTWAHEINENQRVKATFERLAQDIKFDFDSGTVKRFVPQYALGGAYQYLLNKRYLKSFDISGYYSDAESKDLGAKYYFQNGLLFENFRRIAGAKSGGFALGASSQLWPNSKLGFDLNYDNINYHTKYQANEKSSGLGITLSLEQILASRLKVDFTGSDRKPYNEYDAALSFLAPTSPGTKLELQLLGSRTGGNLTLPSDNRIALNMNYSWDGPRIINGGYQLDVETNADSLTNWANTPAVHMNEVLAIKDQRTVFIPRGEIPSSQAIAAQTLYSDDGANSTMTLDIKSLGDFKPDGLKYSVTNTAGISGLYFDDNQEGLLFIPSTTAPGTYKNLTVAANNLYGDTTSQAFDLTIVHAPTPHGETIPWQWSIVGTPGFNFDASKYFTLKTIQNHNFYFVYALINSPNFFNIDEKTGELKADIPDQGLNSPYAITVQATEYVDGQSTGFSIEKSFEVYVKPDSSHDTATYETTKGTEFFIDAAHDGKFAPNQGSLTYALQARSPTTSVPSWLVIDTNSGKISITDPQAEQNGTYNLQVVGTKNPEPGKINPATTTWPLIITINPYGPKYKTPIADQWKNANSEITPINLNDHFDGDGQTITYTLISPTSGLTINNDELSGGASLDPTQEPTQVTIKAETKFGATQGTFYLYTTPTAKSPASYTYHLNQPFSEPAKNSFNYVGQDGWWNYQLNGDVPPGISLENNTITGTFTKVGTYVFTLQGIKNPASSSLTPSTQTVNRQFTINVLPPEPTVKTIPDQWKTYNGNITSVNLNNYFDGHGESLTYTLISPTSGLTINNDELSGGASLNPEQGPYNVEIKGATSGGSVVGNFKIYIVPTGKSAGNYTYNISDNPTIDAATNGFNYKENLSWWSFHFENPATVPPGLTIDPNSGAISGQLTATGEYNFTVVGAKTPQSATELQPASQTVSWQVTMKVQLKLSCPDVSQHNIHLPYYSPNDSEQKYPYVDKYVAAITFGGEAFDYANLVDHGSSKTLECVYKKVSPWIEDTPTLVVNNLPTNTYYSDGSAIIP